MNPSGLLLVLLVAAFVALPLGLALRVLLRLVYGARGPAPNDALHLRLSVASWTLVVGGAVLLSLGSFLFLFLLLAVVISAVLEYILAKRSMQRETAWSLVTRAAKDGQDVAEMVELQKDRFTGVVRSDLSGFVWQLESGEPLPTCVAVWHKAFPREALAHAALGKATGTLPTDKTPHSLWAWTGAIGFPGQMSYLLWVVFAMAAVATWVMIYIVPAFRSIFDDFDMDLPIVTQVFLGFAEFLEASLLFPLGTIAVSLLLLGGIFVLLFYLLDKPVLQGVTDRVFFSRRRAQVLRLLAIAMDHGVPFETALGNLAMGNPSLPAKNVARRLHKALRAAASGTDWKDALQGVRLLHRDEVPLLTAAERAKNLPWALRALSDRLLARSRFRWEAFGEIAYPAVVLLIGLAVMWFCVAMFTPIISLISGLA